ncbi:hypothetical protein R6Q59_024866 [Mikania micrantha]
MKKEGKEFEKDFESSKVCFRDSLCINWFTQHCKGYTISESEKASYRNYLGEDSFLKKVLPIDLTTNDLFEIAKGVLICKLINVAVPGTIDERAINTKTSLGPWERNENHTLCLNFSKAIGCTVVNIGTQDFIEGSNPSTLVVRDHLKRATLVLEHADRMGCKRNLAAKDIAEGSPNLNHAFVAHIFQHRNGLSTPEKPVSFLEISPDEAQVTRESGFRFQD